MWSWGCNHFLRIPGTCIDGCVAAIACRRWLKPWDGILVEGGIVKKLAQLKLVGVAELIVCTED